MNLASVKKVFGFLDPLFFYIVIAYGLGRVYQFMFNTESVWQTLWKNIQLTFGKIRKAFKSCHFKSNFFFVQGTILKLILCIH